MRSQHIGIIWSHQEFFSFLVIYFLWPMKGSHEGTACIFDSQKKREDWGRNIITPRTMGCKNISTFYLSGLSLSPSLAYQNLLRGPYNGGPITNHAWGKTKIHKINIHNLIYRPFLIIKRLKKKKEMPLTQDLISKRKVSQSKCLQFLLAYTTPIKALIFP